jgi:drug/metabolite transporter (DMT)-like permease
MTAGDFARLIALGAIWGAAFLFIRVAAPEIGALANAVLRMLIGGAALAVYFRWIGFDPGWRRWVGQYTVAGVLVSAIPFILYGYAAYELPAGMMAVFNATSPMWGAVLAALLLGERLTRRLVAGLVLGVAGVALVTQPAAGTGASALCILAALGAAFMYGLASVYMKRWTGHIPARGMAVGTQLVAGLLLTPLLVVWPPPAMPSANALVSVFALGLVCGAVGYILFFGLVADVGATGALTVTYLTPVFGVAWGALFLGESLSLVMLAGAALVLLGTFFVVKK